MYVVFYSTSDVFRAEELMKKQGMNCSIVPTPATDRAYCGVCLKLAMNTSLEALIDLEYVVLEE